MDIAIIGMAGRFPKARNVGELWHRLRAGDELISVLSEDELRAEGVDEHLLRDERYVRAKAVLEDAEWMDAAFFGFNPREAELTDPQHRVFLECAWEALENAGYVPDNIACRVSLHAGASIPAYLLFNLHRNDRLGQSTSPYQLLIGNDKDFLTTRVWSKLNLRGPSVSVQTACSTSLVAVVMACQSLHAGETDIALAGGVSVTVPRKAGHYYQPGGIDSPDGHCRPFDARAQGTVRGEGVGTVVLKRLRDALSDGDTIYAVIRGAAINNDGGVKLGYTAPSIAGQASVIRAALKSADVDPKTIGYIEAHGTGTILGDPVEVAALTEAFGTTTDYQFCALGSVKSNMGHLDAAAGIAGLIKAILALRHREIPPTLHFQQPNPAIAFADTPFYVNHDLIPWTAPKANGRRRAGVSSFGIGGTNAHVVLEETPDAAVAAPAPSRRWQLLMLSARTETALDRAIVQLASYLRTNPDVNLSDVAYTLQVGRKAFPHRCVVLCENVTDALAALEGSNDGRRWKAVCDDLSPSIAFVFPGQGCQYLPDGGGDLSGRACIS